MTTALIVVLVSSNSVLLIWVIGLLCRDSEKDRIIESQRREIADAYNVAGQMETVFRDRVGTWDGEDYGSR